MGNSWRVAWLVQAGLVLLAWPVAAQVRIGQLSTDLTGTVSPGYSADYGNMTASDHSWVVGGAGNFSGSYYSPGFLSFNAGLYLNQSRANSNFQSISNASGINLTSNVFGGSRFPGSVNYSKAFNSEGNYAVPGLANFVTHGNSDTLGVDWSENIPGAPSLTAGFQTGSSQYSVYGTSDQGDNKFHSFNLHSGYQFAGFNMGAYFNMGGAHSVIPQVVSGANDTETHSGSSALGFNASHRLPLQGTISGGINRSTWHTDYLGNTSSGAIDIFNVLAAVHPTQKFSLSGTANYSDNLSGQLIQSVVDSGGIVSGLNTNAASDSLDLQGVASYSFAPNLLTSAFVERRSQYFEGASYGDNSFGGSGSYSHTLYEGNFNAALTVTGNSSDQTGADTLGFAASGNYSNQILGWQVSGSFGYSQNMQTLLVTEMNSFYNYSGNARRRWSKFNVGAGASASRTALSQQAGAASSGQSYNASTGYGTWITANGSYSKASGQALETGAGLVPIGLPVSSSLVTLYGGTSYSMGASSTPVKHFLLSASYSKANSDTSSNGVGSTNESDEFSSLVQYQFRKLDFTSGYARLGQGFSASGTKPEVISSFYMGVSRWFNFF